jgi:nucleotide-binding universal stress UspA family protein
MNMLNPTGHADQVSLRLSGVNFKRVLAPVDFSVCSLETLRYAKAFADKFGAMVNILHIVEPGFCQDGPAVQRPSLIHTQTISEPARQELKKLVGILWKNEMDAAVRVREGRPHEGILREACEINAELIIMGTCRHRWLTGLLRRNTVKRVIQKSPCPVMVLRTGMASSGTTGQDKSSFTTRCNFRWAVGG